MDRHFVLIADGKSSPLARGHPSVWCNDELHESACAWLNEEIVPESPSSGTWDTAARSAVTWLDYCSATSVDWRYALREDLVGYRDAYLAAISPLTGRPYKTATVRTRMSYILSFLEYAFRAGYYQGNIVGPGGSTMGRGQIPTDSDLLAHIQRGARNTTSSAARKLVPKQTHDDTVRVIRRQELQQLIQWAGPRPSKRTNDDNVGCDRDFILLALGWAVGLRADEILKMKIYPFESLVVDPEYLGEYFKVQVTGKGNKTRRVDVPAWLVQDIQVYISGERRSAIAQQLRGKNPQLLINGETAKGHTGKPISKSGIDAIMKRACNACGLTERSERINPETAETTAISRPKYSLHCLRHTYAVMTYHNMAESGFDDYERWKYIQLQLGHASPKTTMDVYLRDVSVWSSRRASSILREFLD